jgi:1A family penicillin-binding protein
MGIILIWISTVSLPDFNSFTDRKQINSTKVYDRTGEIVLYDIGSDVRRTSIPYTEMGVHIKNAVVAIEDARFYEHSGISIRGMTRAFIANLTPGGIVQGGSTITQQVIKKSLLVDDRTIIRKFKEILLAFKLEQQYGKDEILGIYLNEIPYGGNVYGIQEATQTFFAKNPIDLTIAEAAYLAAIPNAPSRYSPYGSRKDALENRKNIVLSRLLELGFITQDEFNQAKEEVVTWQPQRPQGIKAPHFVFYVKEQLEERYGVDVVESGGLKVITTLDYTLQQIGEKAVAEYTTGSKKILEKQNGGLVAIDPKTGQILTMVGSRNYFDREIDGNFNVTTARRQPGSAFKPFIYATALKMGYTPETVLLDVPTEFSSVCNPYGAPYPGRSASQCYSPQNYDGKFHGPMSIRSALARSMNIPAVKMLYMVGIKNAIKTAEDMGITTLVGADRYGLSLVLGGGEVRLVEMTSAYGVFAAEGVRHEHSAILKVEDKNGNTLQEWSPKTSVILDRNIALRMSDMLSDNIARTPTFGANSPLHIPNRQVAAKSGTTNNFKDSWAIGYTPSLVAGAWIGRNDNTSLNASVLASPVWKTFMTQALVKYPTETFDKADPIPNYETLPPVVRGLWQGGESYIIDTISGGLATEYTPKETQKEYVITDVHTILHWVQKTNPSGPRPGNPEQDSLYNNWETAVRNWWNANSARYPIVTYDQKPNFTDTVHTPENAPIVNFISPSEGSEFSQNNTITVSINSTGRYPIKKIDVYFNSTFIGTSTNSVLTFTASDSIGFLPGENTILVIVTDTVGNTTTATREVVITE